MRHRLTTLTLIGAAFGLGCAPAPPGPTAASQTRTTTAAVEISALSDEFDRPDSLKEWQRLERVEGWNNDQLERATIEQGWLTLMPFTSTWYKDFRGILLFKPVDGDFVVTTRLRVSRRGGGGPPRTLFNLAGIMVRSPRAINPSTWRPGTENYIFHSLGAGDRPGTYQLEVKQTINSDSQLQLTPAAGGDARIRVVRQGNRVVTMVDQGVGWRVGRRYELSAPWSSAAQVGLTVYADYQTASQMDAATHNRSVIRNGNPDLVAQFDYVRYARPAAGAARIDSASDADLLKAFGGN